MANRGASSGAEMDHEQILAAVVVALGKSSSKVVDYNSENDFSPAPEDEATPRASKSHHHHHFFSCFSSKNSAVKTMRPQPAPIQANSTKFSNWPRSPSHIMSRLLLSPDMSPDRIITKSVASSPGGDQSPARSRFGGTSNKNRQYFSGPILNKRNNKTSMKRDEQNAFQSELREEPTSPKVSCMGTVKAPKKKCSKPAQVFSKPPKCNKVLQQQQHELQSSGFSLDLSRFGDKSGELRLRSGESKQRKQDPAAGTAGLKSDHAKKKSMRLLMSEDDRFDSGVVSGGACSRQSLTIMACRSSSLKKPEEICLWKRRCSAEPMRLQLVEHKLVKL